MASRGRCQNLKKPKVQYNKHSVDRRWATLSLAPVQITVLAPLLTEHRSAQRAQGGPQRYGNPAGIAIGSAVGIGVGLSRLAKRNELLGRSRFSVRGSGSP